MCDFITPIIAAVTATTAAAAPVVAGTAGVAGVAGAAGAAASTGLSIGSLLSGLGTVASIGGTLYQGMQQAQAYRDQAAALSTQAAAERTLAGIEDQRLRARMGSEIARQRAELAGRGVSLDSPTSLLLGRHAARELSFASQSVRSEAQARDTELTNSQRLLRARSRQAVLGGTLSAATGLLSAAPDLWPGFADTRVLA